MRTLLLVCLALSALTVAGRAFAQRPQTFLETPGTLRADEALAEAIEAASRAYARTREKELADWLRVYEKALAGAREKGDQVGVAYLTDAIAQSRQAGFVVKPPPPDALKFEKHSYALVADAVPWHVAKRRCELMGGHLVMLESAGEANFVVASFGKAQFWVGAGDFETEGDHVWLDGSPFQAFDYVARLDNDNGSQHAIFWSLRDQRWDDGDEGFPIGFVCEWDR